MEGKEEISILIIEDEENQIQLIQDAIDDFNEESQHYILNSESVKNFSDSLTLLLTHDFDVAIIDLNLDQTATEPNELDGNKIVDIIRDKLRLPIIIRTGYPTQFSAEELDENNGFLNIYAKDLPVEKIIENIIRWHKIGLSHTLGTKGILEFYLNKLFWVQISQNLKEWEKSEIDAEAQEKSLLRYTLNVLQEYLEIDSDTGDFEHFHPAEVYIKPPVKDILFFGDILKDEDNEYYFILTPACEMAQGKCKRVLLAKITKYDEVEKFMDSKNGYFSNVASTNKKKSLEQWFRNGHKDGLGYHFLPSYTDFSGGLIDFQDIQSIDVANISLEKVATVTSQFAKDISSRFTLYYARQGQPNLNSEMIINALTQIESTQT